MNLRSNQAQCQGGSGKETPCADLASTHLICESSCRVATSASPLSLLPELPREYLCGFGEDLPGKVQAVRPAGVRPSPASGVCMMLASCCAAAAGGTARPRRVWAILGNGGVNESFSQHGHRSGPPHCSLLADARLGQASMPSQPACSARDLGFPAGAVSLPWRQC